MTLNEEQVIQFEEKKPRKYRELKYGKQNTENKKDVYINTNTQ